MDRLDRATVFAEQGSVTRTAACRQHIVDRSRNQGRDAAARDQRVRAVQAVLATLRAAEDAEIAAA